MVEYYGWVCLSDSTDQTNDDLMKSIVEKVDLYIIENEVNKSPGFVHKHSVNGKVQLLLSGFTNHWSQDINEIFDLYHFIANIAEGSYGILYIRNDDDQQLFNEFQVYSLKRGTLIKQKDAFLSPCIPEIED